MLEVAPGVNVRFLRRAIMDVVPDAPGTRLHRRGRADGRVRAESTKAAGAREPDATEDGAGHCLTTGRPRPRRPQPASGSKDRQKWLPQAVTPHGRAGTLAVLAALIVIAARWPSWAAISASPGKLVPERSRCTWDSTSPAARPWRWRRVKPGGRRADGGRHAARHIQIMDNRVNSQRASPRPRSCSRARASSTSRCPARSAQQVVKLVSQTAELQFRQVLLAAELRPARSRWRLRRPRLLSVAPSRPRRARHPAPRPVGHRPGGGDRGGSSGRPAGAGPPRSAPPPAASPSPVRQRRRPRPPPRPRRRRRPDGRLGQRHVHLAAGPAANPSPVSAAGQGTSSTSSTAPTKNWQADVGYTNEQSGQPEGIQIVSCGLSSGTSGVQVRARPGPRGRQPGHRLRQRHPADHQHVLADVNLNFNGDGHEGSSATSPPRCTTSTAAAPRRRTDLRGGAGRRGGLVPCDQPGPHHRRLGARSSATSARTMPPTWPTSCPTARCR